VHRFLPRGARITGGYVVASSEICDHLSHHVPAVTQAKPDEQKEM